MLKPKKAVMSNSNLVFTEVEWKCGICSLKFKDHNVLIEHIVTHFRNLLKQYPYSIQEDIIGKLIEESS